MDADIARRAAAIDPRAGHHAADPRAARRRRPLRDRRRRAPLARGAAGRAARDARARARTFPINRRWRVALIENIQREDLNPLEEAQGLQRLIDEFGLTHDTAAKAVGRSRSAVSNLLRLDAFAQPVQEYVLAGALEMGHARALLALAIDQQSGAAARVVDGALSVRETERLVARLVESGQARGASQGEARLRRRYWRASKTIWPNGSGAVVHIEPGRQGAGRIVIRYSTLDQLDGIVARFAKTRTATASASAG